MRSPDRPAEIRKRVVRNYLQYVTVVFFAHEDLPPRELAGYDRCIDNLALIARANGELELVLSAFAHILERTDIRATEFAGGRYPYKEDEVRAILDYILRKLRTDQLPDGEGNAEVILVE